MVFRTFFTLTSLLVSMTAAAAVAEANALTTKPNLNTVFFDKIAYGGDGCPQGTASVNLTKDKTAFTVIFDAYTAEVGAGIAKKEARAFCQLNLRVHLPGGIQFSVLSATYRGFADLDAGVKATQMATYYYTGESEQIDLKSDIYGPISKDFSFTDTLNNASIVWSPCGTSVNLNMKSQLVLSPSDGSKEGVIQQDSQDGKASLLFLVQWRKC